MPVNPLHAVLEFICNHELYEAFHVLLTQHNIEESIKDKPRLFLLFHTTKIKQIIHQHVKNKSGNILSDRLDELLQSLCYLLPKYQPDVIREYSLVCDKNDNDSDNNKLNNTSLSYSSSFYQIHQEIKIQTILLSHGQHLQNNLLNQNLKSRCVDPNSSLITTLNFRHLDITDTDGVKDDEIALKIADIIGTLKSIINKKKRSKKSSPKIQEFMQTHSWNAFVTKLDGFLNRIKSKYCKTRDLIYNVSSTLIQNTRDNTIQNESSKRDHYYLSEKPVTNTNINKNKMEMDDDHDSECDAVKSIDKYKIGMRVQVQKNKTKDRILGTIVHINNFIVTVELENGAHMRITDMVKIKMLDDSDDGDDINKENVGIEIKRCQLEQKNAPYMAEDDEDDEDNEDNEDNEEEDDEDSDIEIIESKVVEHDKDESDEYEGEDSDVIVLSNENKEDDEESDNENEDEDSKMSEFEQKEKEKEKKTKDKPKKRKRKRRTFWLDSEDNALKSGIQKYHNILHIKKRGARGIWSKIKDDPQFKDAVSNRTAKQLYDRYRVLDRKGQI